MAIAEKLSPEALELLERIHEKNLEVIRELQKPAAIEAAKQEAEKERQLRIDTQAQLSKLRRDTAEQAERKAKEEYQFLSDLGGHLDGAQRLAHIGGDSTLKDHIDKAAYMIAERRTHVL